MKGYQDELDRIKKLLSENPKGLSIQDLSSRLQISRNAMAKYMDILLISGQVERQTYGPAKVYYLSQRVPLSTMADMSSDMMMTFNRDLRVVQANEGMLSLLGAEREEVFGRNIADVAFPFTCDFDLVARSRKAIDGESYSGEICSSTVGGEAFFSIKIMPSTFEDGNPGVMMMLENVTERRLMEDSLRVTKENLSNFFNSIDDFLFVTDEEGVIIHANETVTRRLGYSKEELVGNSMLMAHPRGRIEEARREIREVLEGLRENSTIPLMAKDGTMIPVETKVTRGEWDGRPVVFGVTKDVSQLKLSEEKFSRAFNMNPAATIISRQDDSTVVGVNQAFLDVTGYAPEDVIGKTVLELGIFKDQRQRAKLLSKARRSDHISNVDISVRRKDGETREGSLSVVKIDYAGTPSFLSVMIDITERKEAEERVREQSALLDSLIKSIPDIIFFKDVDGVYLGCNPSFAELVGRPEHEIVGRTDRDLFPRELADFFREQDRIMLEIRQPRHNDEWVTYPDGRRRLVDTLKTPYLGPGGELIGILGVSRDITERRRMDEELKRSEEKLSLAIKGSELGLWDWMVQTGEVEFNERWAQMLGYTLEELAPTSIKTWERLSHPDDLKRSGETLDDYFSGRTKQYECEVRMRHKDGHWIWVLDKGRLSARDADGRPLRMSGTHLDITARKRAEMNLKEAENRYEQLMEQQGIFIWEVDRNGLYSYISRSSEPILGYKVEDIVGRMHFYDLHPQEGRSIFRKDAFEVFSRKETFVGMRNPVETKDGRIIWVSTNGMPVLDENGGLMGYRGSDTDISDKRKLEEDLHRAIKKLSAMDRVKVPGD
jgi:PAS domain S-box-containing protein